MLTAIREKIQGIIAAVIVGLLTLTFATWGVSFVFEGAGKKLVAEGEGVSIGQQEFEFRMEQFRRSGRFPPALMDNPVFRTQIQRQVLNGMVTQAVFARDVESHHYGFDDQQLKQLLHDRREFQVNGNFDVERYQGFLRTNQLSAAEYERDIRIQAVDQQIRNAFIESVIVTEDEVLEILTLQGQEREFAYAMIDSKRFVKQAQPSTEEIEAYYKANQPSFMTTEQLRIAYVRLAAVDLAKDYNPSEQELREAYDNGMVQTVAQAEQRYLSHILIEVADSASAADEQQALAKIKGLAEQLGKGASFAKLAKQHSQDPGSADKGGDLGELRPGVMVQPFEEAAMALRRQGEISEPVRTPFGYHLIELTKYRPAKILAFREVRDELAKTLKRQYADDRYHEILDSFETIVYEQPDSLKPAADEFGLKVEQSDWFSRSGGRDIAAKQQVVATAFSPEVLESGRNSEVIELEDGVVMALRVLEHRQSEAKPLAQVTPLIKARLQQQKARELASAMRETVLEDLRAGQSLTAVAKQHKLAYHKPVTVKRNAIKDSKLDAQLLQAVFRAPRPQGDTAQYQGVQLGNGDVAVFALQLVRHGDSSKMPKDQRESLIQLLKKRRGEEYYQHYLAGLRQRADIKIYENNL